MRETAHCKANDWTSLSAIRQASVIRYVRGRGVNSCSVFLARYSGLWKLYRSCLRLLAGSARVMVAVEQEFRQVLSVLVAHAVAYCALRCALLVYRADPVVKRPTSVRLSPNYGSICCKQAGEAGHVDVMTRGWQSKRAANGLCSIRTVLKHGLRSST